MVFLNSIRATRALLEQRSANYSDRNRLPMINELCVCPPAPLHALTAGLPPPQNGLGLELRTHALRCVCVGATGSALISKLRAAGDRWRAHRKVFHRQFQASAVPVFWPIQRRETHALLRRLLDTPHAFVEHLRQCVARPMPRSARSTHHPAHSHAASTMMRAVYDIEVAPHGDRYITVAEAALAGMAEAARPGAFLVDLLPMRTSPAPPRGKHGRSRCLQ